MLRVGACALAEFQWGLGFMLVAAGWSALIKANHLQQPGAKTITSSLGGQDHAAKGLPHTAPHPQNGTAHPLALCPAVDFTKNLNRLVLSQGRTSYSS